MMELLQQYSAHWPFVAAALIFGLFGATMKRVVSKELAAKSRAAWVFRATMPLHPIVAGIGLGLIPGMPVSPGVDTAAARALYFAFAGVSSTWVYEALRHWARSRGIKINGNGPAESP